MKQEGFSILAAPGPAPTLGFQDDEISTPGMCLLSPGLCSGPGPRSYKGGLRARLQDQRGEAVCSSMHQKTVGLSIDRRGTRNRLAGREGYRTGGESLLVTCITAWMSVYLFVASSLPKEVHMWNDMDFPAEEHSKVQPLLPDKTLFPRTGADRSPGRRCVGMLAAGKANLSPTSKSCC